MNKKGVLIYRFGLLALGVWFGAQSALASELDVQLKFENTSYLQYEQINAIVTIRNESGALFSIDVESAVNDARLEFVVRRKQYETSPRISRAPIVKRLNIVPDAEAQLMLPVSDWYDMRAARGYIVSVLVEWGGRRYESNRVMIDVVNGIDMCSVEKGLDVSPGVMRTYSLRYWTRERMEHLFLVVSEEPSGMSYGVFDLGTLVRIADPELKADRQGRIEIRHQSGVNRYTHSFFRSEKGRVVFIDQQYHKSDDGS